jgi:hypothetical protein
MEPGQVILTDGYELQDAMTAFEVRHSLLILAFPPTRFSSGRRTCADWRAAHGQRLAVAARLEASVRPQHPAPPGGGLLDHRPVLRVRGDCVRPPPPTHPLTPAHIPLPHRQMAWHAGSTLSQTVFSFLYVHHVDDLNPEYMYYNDALQDDPARPMELLCVVLRAATFGLLKCCDMAWRELNKSRVFEVRAPRFPTPIFCFRGLREMVGRRARTGRQRSARCRCWRASRSGRC